jgi:hypothetical protein
MNQIKGATTVPVKRLLRNRQSLKYFKADGWTENAAEALAFDDALDAAQVCARCELKDIDLVLRIEETTCDVFCTPLR